jgi:hypothetical protein
MYTMLAQGGSIAVESLPVKAAPSIVIYHFHQFMNASAVRHRKHGYMHTPSNARYYADVV